jgi:pimeloyl-ACP methyl ester carboxylesterase
VLLFDLRAHGNSKGTTTDLSGEDVLAAVRYLQSRNDVDQERIGSMGFSLGALVTLQAAAQSDAIKAVVSDGTAAAALKDYWPPPSFADALRFPGTTVFFVALDTYGTSSPMSTGEAVAAIAPRPLLLIAGAANELERRLSQRFYNLAGEPKELWSVPGVGHGGAWATHPGEYAERIVNFFNAALPDD